ncbi:MAG: toll/interleukin-1 receptor domain-containing protein, partial [bacterium]|nr:toll/interleukin-1 receptor domain-containing protein [bacterium]
MEPKKTFLSHNSRDKSFVEPIAHWLENEAGPVWLDKWNLIPGDPWLEEIDKALDASHVCLIFIGHGGIGPWQNEEMRSAIDARVSAKTLRVIPVLLPGVRRPLRESKLPRFLRGLTWLEFNEKWDEFDVLASLVLAIDGKKTARELETEDKDAFESGVCPYRGLERFREQDRRFFYGREVLEMKLLNKLAGTRFLAVAGPSGSGKSSIVQAGLISTLRPQTIVALLKPGEQPLEELAFALCSCYPREEKPSLNDLLNRLQKGGKALHYIARDILENFLGKKLLIVIDQFEEIFTQSRDDEKCRLFVSLLLEAMDVVMGPVTVVLSIRSDFIGECVYYKDLNIYITENLVQVEPLDMDELHRAIEIPAHLVGLRFEKWLVNHILKDIKGVPGELPLLEHALLELYERREDGVLLFSAYEEIDGIAGALVKRAEKEFHALNYFEKEILRKMFVLRLIQPGEGTEDTRRRADKEDLLAVGGEAAVVEGVLSRWMEVRLLTGARDSHGHQVVEIAHEVLIHKWERVREWMEMGREEAHLTGSLRLAVLDWVEENRNPAYLFQGARLIQMEGLMESHIGDLTEDEVEFVKAGVAKRGQKERKELQTALDLAHENDMELTVSRKLSVTKSNALKRTRIILTVLLMCLMTVSYLFYQTANNEKETR